MAAVSTVLDGPVLIPVLYRLVLAVTRPAPCGAGPAVRGWWVAVQFRAELRLDGKTATGIEVPPEVLTELGAGKRPRVKVTINNCTYQTAVGSMGGRFLVPVSADIRKRASVAAGDQIAVGIELDSEPRTVTVPPDLASALGREPAARQVFEQLSYTGQNRHVLAVEAAKTPQTRQRRIEKAVTALAAAAASPS